jgi:hypothetical protein
MAGGGQRFPVVGGLFNRNVPRRNTGRQNTQSLCGGDHSHV